MRRFRSFISFVLALSMILGIQVISAKNVNAAKKKFTNVVFENNVLTWDPVPNVNDDGYKIRFTRTSIDYDVTQKRKNEKFDFQDFFWTRERNGLGSMPGGNFKVTLTAKDTDGKSYQWKGTVAYVDNLIRQVTDLKWENGYLTWKHDRSNVSADTDLKYYVDVYVDGAGTFEAYNFLTTDTKFSDKNFSVVGTHKYVICVGVSVEDSGRRVPTLAPSISETRTIDAAAGLSGVKLENGILKWNSFPGADHYVLSYGYYVSNRYSSGSFDITETSIDVLQKFYQSGAESVALRLIAYNGSEVLAPSTNLTYKVDLSKIVFYPLIIKGERLDSLNYDELVKQVKAYDPKTNTVTISGAAFDRYGADAMYGSKEDLIVKGDINHAVSGGGYRVLFDCEKSLTFADGFTMDFGSGATVIKAKNVVFSKGSYYIENTKNTVVTANNDITVKKGCTLEIKTVEGNTAIEAGGRINLNGSVIALPKGGKLDKSGKTILNADGTVASHVKIVPAPATPKPTGKVTPAPVVANKPSVTIVPPSDSNSAILSFVERIYKYVLDREPEAEGAAFWTEELYSFRRTGAEVGMQFIFSDEFIARNLSNEDFVTVLYKTFFGRDPEEEGFKFWTSALADGTLDRQAVASGFIYSQEWADTCASYGIRSGGDIKPNGVIVPSELTYAFVERLYVTAMGRSYDEEGRQYWASELANFNITGEQAGAAFMLSDEMNSYGLSTEEYVKRLYKTFMDREPEEDGYAYWVGFLNDGNSREGAVFGFSRSEEFVNKCIEARILPY